MVETELKSGTSSFHGDLYEFVRNTDFNAKNYFNASTPPYHKNDFGGTIDGLHSRGLQQRQAEDILFLFRGMAARKHTGKLQQSRTLQR